MSHLKVEVVKKSCAFILQIENPGETLKQLSMFFQERKLQIDTLNMYRYKAGDATLIVHCQVEKEKIAKTVELLEHMPGIMELERMEEK